MFFRIKQRLGEFLFDIGYLAELRVDYSYPYGGVYFGRTTRKLKKDYEKLKELNERQKN